MKNFKFDFSSLAIIIIAVISICSLALSVGKNNNTSQILEELQNLRKNIAVNSVLNKESNNATTTNSEEINGASYDNGMAIIQDEIRNILKTELKGFLTELKDEDGFEYKDMQTQTSYAKVSEKEQKVSFDRGLEIVHDAVSSGRWTYADARDIKACFRKMSKEKKLEVLQALIPAINRGEIKVETRRLF